jgi:hypothetical protein
MREGRNRLRESEAIDVTYDIAVIVRSAMLNRLNPDKLIRHDMHYNTIGMNICDVLPASIMEEINERTR